MRTRSVAGVLALSVALLHCGNNDNTTASDPPTNGNEGRPCFPNKTCSGALSCSNNLCVVLPNNVSQLTPGSRPIGTKSQTIVHSRNQNRPLDAGAQVP